MSNFLDDILATAKEGNKLEITVLESNSKIQTLSYTYEGPSGKAFSDADYTLDFESRTWERRYLNISEADTGIIPNEAAERFVEAIGFIAKLDKDAYITDSKRTVPANYEERYILQSETKQLTRCTVHVYGKKFQWIAEKDTAEPYRPLFDALETLREECGLK